MKALPKTATVIATRRDCNYLRHHELVRQWEVDVPVADDILIAAGELVDLNTFVSDRERDIGRELVGDIDPDVKSELLKVIEEWRRLPRRTVPVTKRDYAFHIAELTPDETKDLMAGKVKEADLRASKMFVDAGDPTKMARAAQIDARSAQVLKVGR